MSTESHHSHPGDGELPRNDTVSFEKRDVEVRSIYWYLIVLTITVAACFFVSVYILKYTKGYVSQNDPVRMPAREAMGPGYHTMPPEPRLQGVPGHENDPQQDRRDKVQADTESNESYGWVNQQAGVAKIPVSEAMKIVAEKGLNTAPEKKVPTAQAAPAATAPEKK
jgi:hypothetical protein